MNPNSKNNKLSKFIFDFYRTPDEDDSFGDQESTDQYSFNRRD